MGLKSTFKTDPRPLDLCASLLVASLMLPCQDLVVALAVQRSVEIGIALLEHPHVNQQAAHPSEAVVATIATLANLRRTVPLMSTSCASIRSFAAIATCELEAHGAREHGQEVEGEAVDEGHAQQAEGGDAVDGSLLPVLLPVLGLLLLARREVEDWTSEKMGKA